MKRYKETHGLRTWVEIDTKAIKKNYNRFRGRIARDCALMSVVKSNAYGHGLIPFSEEVSNLGVDWFGVDSLVEGVALRKAGITKPILVLGNTLPEMISVAIKNEISLTISNLTSLKNARNYFSKNKARKKLKIHIKVDTGMHRQGFLPHEMNSVIKTLKGQKTLTIEGLYTHFAAAKNPSFPEYTIGQIDEFKKWIDAFKESGFDPLVHASATSGTLLFPEAHFDMVRIGIGMYGLPPSLEVASYIKGNFPLESVLSWKTLVSEIKDLPQGSKVGYDLTETFKNKARIAILPIGYWHGYPRTLSSIGHVLIKGESARVVGRVSMDMIVVDVTTIPNVKIGDEVVLIGAQGKKHISTQDFSNLSETVNYEAVTRINPLIRRIKR